MDLIEEDFLMLADPNAFVSYALGNKEPNREDFEAGVTRQPKAETLHDFEAAVEKRTTSFSYGATGYYMLYKNQLILTGQINDVGSYTRVNVPNSYRLGVELQAKAMIATWMNAGANLTLSRNKITNSEEYLDDYDNGGQVLITHKNADISFSPSVIGGLTLNFIPVKNAEISLMSKYVSRQYLDNTSDVTLRLASKPKSISINGKRISESKQLRQNNWQWQPLVKGGVLHLQFSGGNQVVISK